MSPFLLEGQWITSLHMGAKTHREGVLSFRFGNDLIHVELVEAKARNDAGKKKHY